MKIVYLTFHLTEKKLHMICVYITRIRAWMSLDLEAQELSATFKQYFYEIKQSSISSV